MRGAPSGRYVALAFGVLGAALVACGAPEPTEPDAAPKAGEWRVSGELGFPFGRVNDVDAFDADNIWVTSDHVAEEDDGSSIARWDGRRWAKVELPEDFGRASWMQVRVAGPRDVWAWGTGYDLDAGQQWKELRRWDGSTWHKVAVPTPPDGFAIVASDDVWVVAETEPRANHWDGKRWRAFALPNVGRGCFDRMHAVAPDDVWAFGRDPCSNPSGKEFAIAAHWDGAAWSKVALPKQAPIWKVTAAGTDDLWAASDGTLMHWDGETWNAVDPPPSRPESVGAIASDGAGGLWVTESRSIGPTKLLHRDKAGRWTTHDDPSGDSTVEHITLVPGTRTLWAVGGQDYSGYPPPGAPLLMRYSPS